MMVICFKVSMKKMKTLKKMLLKIIIIYNKIKEIFSINKSKKRLPNPTKIMKKKINLKNKTYLKKISIKHLNNQGEISIKMIKKHPKILMSSFNNKSLNNRQIWIAMLITKNSNN